jgi:subtilisin
LERLKANRYLRRAVITTVGVAGLLSALVLQPRLPAAEAQAPSFVPGQFIVVLKDQVANPQAVAADLAQQHGAELLHVYDVVLKGFAARVPGAALRAIAGDARVKYVERDQYATAIGCTHPNLSSLGIPTGVDRVNAETAPLGNVGNVDIAVIDTGIQPDHPNLKVVGGINLITADGPGGSWADGNGHGTHVAGTAAGSGGYGMAPGARLYAVKVLNAGGSGTYSDIVAAVNHVAGYNVNGNRIEVCNMSLGGGRSTALNDAVNNAVLQKVTMVVAAGNSGMNAASFSPASASNALTVAALADSDGKPGRLGPATDYGADDTFATFSNYGSIVDLIAPGVCVTSTWPGGGSQTISGTSMASPCVAGLAARCIARNNLVEGNRSPSWVRSALMASVEYISGPGRTYPLPLAGAY